MKKRLVSVLLVLSLMCGIAACGKTDAGEVTLDPKNPVLLSIWNYYNGMQLEIFEEMIDEFNNSVGLEKGIVVESHSLGSVQELTDAVNASMAEEPGADDLPDIFAAYADTAYEADQKGVLADLGQYISKDEQAEYLDAYMQEGYLNNENSLKLFPVAKSTEIMLLNETAWAEFEKETGADKSELATWEGVVDLAQQYYEWTDAKTPDVLDDGKAFFGRDAIANYMIIGSLQLGTELFQVTDGQGTCVIDDTAMRKLWDCYYVPYVQGWFGSYGKFRSDDIKTGQIICLVGSTSGGLYFPSEVTSDDGTTSPIEGGVYALPNFEGTEPYAVQQGAGYVVAKSTPEKEYAASIFLKWFTQADNNIRFSIDSGYLPVKKEANNKEIIDQALEEKQQNGLLKDIMDIGVETTTGYTLYTSKAFENGSKARSVAENNIQDAANKAVEQKEQMMAEGMTREEAVAKLTNDAAFNSWLLDFKSAMNDAIAGK